MLELKDVRYPISFKSRSCGLVFFTSANNAVWESGTTYTLGLAYMIKQHNKHHAERGHYAFKSGAGEIIYPIVFQFDNGEWLLFKDKESSGVFYSGITSNYQVEEYIQDSNEENPQNEPGKNFSFIMGKEAEDFLSKQVVPAIEIPLAVIGNAVISQVSMKVGVNTETNDTGTCQIERMPLGARIQQVRNNHGDMVDFHFEPNRIETGGGHITLLNDIPGVSAKAEVNFNYGTVVRWEMPSVRVEDMPF